MDTSSLICSAYQWTGFYMIRTTVMKCHWQAIPIPINIKPILIDWTVEPLVIILENVAVFKKKVGFSIAMAQMKRNHSVHLPWE